MKLRERKPKVETHTELLARLFEEDFDSENPSELIQFKRSSNRFTRQKSRRLRKLSPKHTPAVRTKLKKQSARSSLPDHMALPLHEIIINPRTRLHSTPKCGWNGMVRRVIQCGFISMGKPAERDQFGRNVYYYRVII